MTWTGRRSDELGATRLSGRRSDELGDFIVPGDPEGNEFCVVTG